MELVTRLKRELYRRGVYKNVYTSRPYIGTKKLVFQVSSKRAIDMRRLPKKGCIGGVFYKNLGPACESAGIALKTS